MLQNRDKELATVKAQLLKLHTKNKHLVAKGVEVKKEIKKVEALQQEYNELNLAHFKTRYDLKGLQIDLHWLTRAYGKMEAISVQHEKEFIELENTCLQQREQLIKVKIDMENCTHELWVQIQELKGELETFRQTLGKISQTTYMDNQLKGFEELLLDNALFKVKNQALVDKSLKWKEWWKIIQEIMEEQIHDSLEIAHVDEEAYLNELVAYQLHFEGYINDWFNGKLDEVPIIVSQPVQTITVDTNSQNEPIITTTKEPEPIKGGVELTIVYCILSLRIEFVEVFVVVVNIQVEELEEPITPKPIPLTIPKIRVGVEVTLINIVTHAFKVFRTPNIVLKDTPIVEKPRFESIPLAEPIDTIGEQHVDDLVARIEQVVIGDKF